MPFFQRKVPRPSMRSSTHEPEYCAPLSQIKVPWPWRRPRFHSPTYARRVRSSSAAYTRLPLPWYSSSTRSPRYCSVGPAAGSDAPCALPMTDVKQGVEGYGGRSRRLCRRRGHECQARRVASNHHHHQPPGAGTTQRERTTESISSGVSLSLCDEVCRTPTSESSKDACAARERGQYRTSSSSE